MSQGDSVRAALDEAAAVQSAFRADRTAMGACDQFADAAFRVLSAGGTLYSCGNGGSMSDAMHFAEEWSGRFRGNRRALPAVAFSDPAAMTCIANDFGFDHVFSRQVEAQARRGDLLLVVSTSGNSANLVLACGAARTRGLTVVGLLGRGGGALRALCDIAIVVPLGKTSDRIQEVHIQVIHGVIEAVERRMFPENYGT